MRVRSMCAVAAAFALATAACGGGDDAGGDGSRAEGWETVELPLSFEARCDTDSGDTRGCVGSEPVPTGATLVDDDMRVQVVGSSFVTLGTDDPVNTTGNRATVYVEITNLRDHPMPIDNYYYDLRFDGVFERDGSNLEDCGMVPRRGEIAPGESLNVRFCGYLATVGAMVADELVFDLHAPCAWCDAFVTVDDGPASSDLVDAVAAAVDALAAAGFGTVDELGLGGLDADRSGGNPPGASPAPSEPADPADPGSQGAVTVPPPPPPVDDGAVTTEPGVGGTGEGPFGDEVTIGDTVPEPPADATVTVPTTQPPDDVAANGLVLAPDGLGVVDFDATVGETLAVLTGLLGEPDEATPQVFEPAIGTLQTYRWGHLSVQFTGGNELYFTGYELAQQVAAELDEDSGAYEFVLTPYDPADWEAALATADGVTIGTSAEAADAAYQPVFAPQCGGTMDERSIIDQLGTVDQLFTADEERGLYVREPIDGAIWAIGAQLRPNPLLCDGATG